MFISISYVCVLYNTIKWPYQPKYSPSLIYAVGWLGINGPFGRHGPCRELVMKNCLSQLDCQCAQLLSN